MNRIHFLLFFIYNSFILTFILEVNVMKQIYDISVVGGGLSGVSFANSLIQKNEKLNVAVLESSSHLGGALESKRYHNFWFEMGGHTIYNSYQQTLNMIDKNNVVARDKAPFMLMLKNNQIKSVLSQVNKFTLGLNLIKGFKSSKQNKTVKEFISKLFGKNNYLNCFRYCFDAVLSQDSANFPMQYLFKKAPKNKDFPRSFTLKDGIKDLVKLDKKIEVLLNKKIITIKKKENLWHIQSQDQTIVAKNICLATDFSTSQQILGKYISEFTPKTTKFKSVAIVVKKSQTKHIKKLTGLIGVKKFFYSVITRDYIDDDNFRAFVFHCKPEFSNLEEIMVKIQKSLNISKDDILNTYSKDNILPCYDRHHYFFLKDLENFLNYSKNIYIVGNFFDRMAIESCIERANFEAKRFFDNNL